MSDNSITVFKNGVSQKITENFSSGEFDCNCGCDETERHHRLHRSTLHNDSLK